MCVCVMHRRSLTLERFGCVRGVCFARWGADLVGGGGRGPKWGIALNICCRSRSHRAGVWMNMRACRCGGAGLRGTERSRPTDLADSSGLRSPAPPQQQAPVVPILIQIRAP